MITRREDMALDRLAHLRARLQTLPPLFDVLRTEELEELAGETSAFVARLHAEIERRDVPAVIVPESRSAQ